MDLAGFTTSGETVVNTSNGSTSAPGGTCAATLFHLATDSHGGTVLTYG